MIKRLLKNKTGVTILEGLIALGLLALVAGGTFGVLLSVSRKASQPDIREEMLLAVERANEQLQMYADYTSSSAILPEALQNGLCGGDSDPLAIGGAHHIRCLLPAICDMDPAKSDFKYTVTAGSLNVSGFPFASSYRAIALPTPKKITFDITCNGFSL